MSQKLDLEVAKEQIRGDRCWRMARRTRCAIYGEASNKDFPKGSRRVRLAWLSARLACQRRKTNERNTRRDHASDTIGVGCAGAGAERAVHPQPGVPHWRLCAQWYP